MLIISFFSFSSTNAQNNIPLGTWRSHFAVNNTVTLDWNGENTIYAGAPQGIVRFDVQDNSTEQLSKQDGFSEIEVSKIKYHKGLKVWLFTYVNGNIDILDGNTIYNLNGIIRNTNITTSKKINHISFNGNDAYLSTDFGIVVLNLAKKEIKESYLNIGDNGSSIKTYSTTFLNDSVFIAGSRGIIAASLDPRINKLDYRSWAKIKNNTHPQKPTVILNYKLITASQGKLYAVIDSFGISSFSNNEWEAVYSYGNQTSAIYNQLTTINNQIFTSIGDVFIRITNDTDVKVYSGCSAPLEIASHDGSHFWTVSNSIGICYNDGTNPAQSYSTKTVYNPASFRLYGHGNTMTCTSGGYNNAGQPALDSIGFYQFDESGWTNYDETLNTGPYTSATFQTTFNPFNGYYYISCLNGLLKWKSNSDYLMYNALNSNGAIEDLWKENFTSSAFIFNTGVACDSKGTIWSSYSQKLFPETVDILNSLDLAGNWKTYRVPYNELFASGDLFVDSHDNKWMIPLSSKSGVIVFNENSSPQTKELTMDINKGGMPSLIVNCLASAKNGDVWVGTGNGVCIFNDPANIMRSQTVNASLPVYDSRALLRNKIVTCIKVDAADRKWIATTDGLWFFNQDGSELLAYFNTENSPLPSNSISSIDIIETTGELFIATIKGIVSYRGDATLGKDDENSNVSIFPNPVKPDFNGKVAISGIVNNAVVKVTDISGQLIYQCVANGSTATWDLKDLNNKRVAPGVYLFFSSSSLGEDSLITKLAVLE